MRVVAISQSPGVLRNFVLLKLGVGRSRDLSSNDKTSAMAEKPIDAAHIEKSDPALSVSSSNRDEESTPREPGQDWTEEEEKDLV